jgi:leucyl-tRNA synthetase
VQVNGKIRARIAVPPDISAERAYDLAMEQAAVLAHVDSKTVRKRVFVPGKLLNLVVG